MSIVIALDRTEYAEIVAEHGFDQAVRRNADEIHVITAVDHNLDVEPTLAWLAEATAELVDAFHWHGRTLVRHAVVGRPADVITSACSELRPELIVMGRFRSPGIVDDVLDRVECPVLVVGINGHEVEPQCPRCARVRKASGGERLFCDEHLTGLGHDMGLPSSILAGLNRG